MSVTLPVNSVALLSILGKNCTSPGVLGKNCTSLAVLTRDAYSTEAALQGILFFGKEKQAGDYGGVRTRMKASKLAQARIEKGFTQPQVAEHVEVDTGTICRWEKGTQRPYPRHVKKLCTLFGKSAQELGLEPFAEPEEAPPSAVPVESSSEESILFSVPTVSFRKDNPFAKYFRRDIELRLNCILYDWLHCKPSSSRAMLQYLLSKELEDDDSMTTNEQQPRQNHEGVDLAKRAALRRLALVPIYALGLDTLGAAAAPKWAPEDLLTHCAAGITACHHLSKGNYDDMSLAHSVLSTYLTPLKEIVEQSSLHRKEAARLAAQALWINAVLSVHREGPKRAISYGKQAEIYSKESGDPSLRLITLQNLAWFYSCDRKSKQALQTILRAQNALENADVPIHPLVQSDVYGAVAKYQAQNGKKDDAISALHAAYDMFPEEEDTKKKIAALSENGEKSHLVDFNRSTLILKDGLAHYYLGQYEEAFNTLSQAIDPETLTPKVPASSERVRIEIINHQTLASLKRPKRDKELSISLWLAGRNGTFTLHSEQRYTELLSAYDIMEALWSDDRHIEELRDLTRHW